MKTGISLTSIVRVLCDRIRSVRGSHASGLVKHTTFGTVFEPLETRLLLDATILGPAEFNWTIEPQIVQIYQHPSNSGDEPPDFWWDFNINDGLKPEAARVEILQSTPQIIEGHVYIPGLAHFERNVDGVDYTIFELSEHVNGGNVGQAQLPTIRTFFEVPDNVNISWKITPELVLDLGDSFTMFPVQPNQSESSTEDMELKIDSQYYNGLVPGEAACQMLDPFIIRGYEIIGTEISPFIYDPQTGNVQVVTEFSFEIEFSGHDDIQYPEVDARLASPFYDSLVSSLVANHTPVSSQYINYYNTESTGADYLIITANAFYEEVLPLAQWKQQKGFITQVTKMSDIGSSYSDVAAYIQDAYDNWTIAPSYVLLVGDYNDVPSPDVGYMADNVYACVDGTDFLPDLTIGRLSVHTEAETINVVNKILTYDQNPDSGDWYNDALIAAYLQAGPTAERFFMETAMHAYQYLQNEQGMDMHTALTTDSLSYSQYYYRPDTPPYYPHRLDIVSQYEPFASSLSQPYPVPTWISDMFVSPSQSTQQVTDAINGGVGYVLHRDHGGETLWGDPPYSVSNINQLTNSDMTPVVFSLNCLTGTFNYSGGDCFAEALLKHPNGGAVGVVGASAVSYSGFNDLLTHGINTCFWSDYDPTFGASQYIHSMRPAEALVFGKYYMYNYEGSNADTERTFNIFHWFGDPEMMLRTDSPHTLTVNHPDILPLLISTDVTITVTDAGAAVAGALVCISCAGSNEYWTGLTDASGTITFTGLSLTSIDDYNVVVTASNANPYIGTISTVSEGPIAELAYPLPGDIINTDTGYIDINWIDYSAMGINAASLDANDISISGVTFTGSPIDLGNNVWRYTYQGNLPTGVVDVVSNENEVQDNMGDWNMARTISFIYDTSSPTGNLVNPANNSVVYVDYGYVDINWTDVGEARIDVTTLDANDITITGVTITDVPTELGGDIWRYEYNGDLATGTVTVNLVPGEVIDQAGNSNLGENFVFTYSPLEQITPTVLPPASVDHNYMVELEAQGGLTPYTWSSLAGSAIMITEIDPHNNDSIEFTNVAGIDINMSGWQVLIYDFNHASIPYIGITFDAGTICPADGIFIVQEYGTGSGTHPLYYTGQNIDWTDSSTSMIGVMLLDGNGLVVDFMTAAGLLPSSITSPFAVVPDHWVGSQASPLTNSTYNYVRTGNTDNNNASDWTSMAPSLWTLNAGLTIPFNDTGHLPVGFTIDPTTGIISGIPTEIGGYDFSILVADSDTPANNSIKQYHLDVYVAPPLYLDIAADDATEGDGLLQASVSITHVLTTDLVVNLESSDTTEATIPATVTILAGQTTATFNIQVIDDSELDWVQDLIITATAIDYVNGTALLNIHDNETADLTVSVPATATEGDGMLVNQGLITVSEAPTSDVTIELNSNDTSEVTVPQTVTLLAGQTTAAFSLTVFDDNEIDNLQSVEVSAYVENWTIYSATIDIIDDENFDLVVTMPPQAWESDYVLTEEGLVSISGILPYDLVVSLSSDDISELTVPATVIILAGQTSVNFDITVIDDSDFDGGQITTLTAEATGFNNGQTTIEVKDDDIHHFAFDNIADQSAGVAFSTSIQALDINNQLIDIYQGQSHTLSATGANGSLPIDPQTIELFVNGIWTGDITFQAFDTDVTLTIDNGAGIIGTSNIFDVNHGPIDQFIWDTIPGTQYTTKPFDVTITAVDVLGYTVSDYSNTVNLEGIINAGTNSTIVITECSFNTPDFVEIQNVSGHDIDTTGWFVVVNNAEYGSINDYHSILWYLPSTITTDEILYRDDSTTNTSHYWGSNIWWNSTSGGWAMIVDDVGTIVDAVVWAYDSSSIAAMNIDVNGHSLSLGSAWTGPAITNNINALSLQREGDFDNDDDGDWVWQNNTNTGIQNTGLITPFTGGTQSIAIAPTSTISFINGIWTGSIQVLDVADEMFLRIDDLLGHSADSNMFNVELYPPISINAPVDVTEVDGTIAATVDIPFAIAQDLTVNLVSDDTSELIVPATVVILAGQTSADFDITVIDDTELDWIRSVTITPSATEYTSNSIVIDVHDNETAVITVDVPDSVTENDGVLTGQGVITANQAPSHDVVIELASSDETELVFNPATVVLLAGTTSVVFDLSIIDDLEIDGDQLVTVSAYVENWTSYSDDIQVVDNEHLDVIVDIYHELWENAGEFSNGGMVEISGILPYDLEVALTSSDETELILPQTVIIPTGSTQVFFTTTMIDDTDFDGVQTVTVEASATGFNTGTTTTQIMDDDVHHYQIDPIDEQIASVDFDITVRAMDINDNHITIHYCEILSLSAMDATGTIPVDPTAFASMNNGLWTGQIAVHGVATDVILTVTSPTGISGSSDPFNLVHGPVDYYVFDTIDSVQYAEWPIDITISAYDANGYLATDFTDSVDLNAVDGSIAQNVTIGTGTGTWYYPLHTYWHDARTQVIYLSSELTGPGLIDSLSLNVYTLPPQVLNYWTIRMKHTPLSSYDITSFQWESTDWTTVYQANQTIPHTGWVTFQFDTPFDYNGIDNLMIDFCYNNTHYTSNAFCCSTQTDNLRSICGYSDSMYGNPLTWSSLYGPTGGAINAIPNIQLSTNGTPLSLTPTSTGAFTNGIWTGTLTIHESGDDVILQAQDSNGHLGFSNHFAVEPQPTITITSPSFTIESGGVLSGKAEIPFALTYDLEVILESSDTTEVVVPASVIITTGQTYADFDITVIDDNELDPYQNVNINAQATLFIGANSDIAILDNETAELFVTLPGEVTEGDGQLIGQGAITVSKAPSVDVPVQLESNDTTELTLPDTVTIMAGQTSATFDLIVMDDNKIDDMQHAIVSAHVSQWTPGFTGINIIDDEHRNLMVTLPSHAWESDGLLSSAGMVTISGTLEADLEIVLATDDSTELTTETPIIISAGQTQAAFDLAVIDDATYDGIQSAGITAQALEFNDGTAYMNINDDDVHHFIFDMSGWTSVTASIPFEVTITAVDINNETIIPYNKSVQFSGTGDNGPVTIEPIATDQFVDGIWSGFIAVHDVDTSITIQLDDGLGHTGQSPVFDSNHGPIHHFGFSDIGDTQYVDWPFSVTVTAQDLSGYTITDFNDTCELMGYDTQWLSVPVSPVSTTNFVNGVWTGMITVEAESAEMFLSAQHATGTIGHSETFTTCHLPAPIYIDLVTDSDTGLYDNDNVTKLNNSDVNNTMQFVVNGTIPDTMVVVFADGIEIGQAAATGTATTVTTNGYVGLIDGSYQINAQALGPNGQVSTLSQPMLVTVDTAGPQNVTVHPQVTSDTTPSISGTVDDPGASLELTIAGQNYIATNQGDNAWTLADNTIDVPLVEGIYDVHVTATDLAGNTIDDTTIDELHVITSPPPCPIDLFAYGHDGMVSLSWHIETDQPILYYMIYRSTTAGSDHTPVAVAFGSTTICDYQVYNDTTYYYMVKAVNSLGMISDYSDEIAVTPQLPIPYVLIPYTDTAPMIDCHDNNAVWANIPAHHIGNINYGTVTDNLDLSAAWKVMWDSDHLYYMVEVTDDNLIQDSPVYQSPDIVWWDDDCIEIFIDADNSKLNQYDGMNDYQFGFRWNDSTVRTGQNSLVDVTGVRFDMVNTDKGYRLEAAIPWFTLGITPSEGMYIGTDVQIDDDDDGGERDGKRAWFETIDNAWFNPGLLATAQLSDEMLIQPWAGQDVGDVTAYGSYSEDTGVFTVLGDGSDIWYNADKFYFVSQSYIGDFEVMARVDSLEYTNEWAKAGVMVRESLDAGSKHAYMTITPGQGMAFQRRLETDAASVHSGIAGAAPGWVKLVRLGDTVYAYASTDGVNWTEIGCETIVMPTNVFVGLAVTSHSDGVLCEATISNVSVTPINQYHEQVIDDSDPAIVYSGTWTERTGIGGRLNNTTHETDHAGAAVELAFTGNTIELISEKQPWGGNADIYIDGVYNQTASYYHNSPDQHQQSIFRIAGLNYGEHTLRVECNGDGWIYIDAVRINGIQTWICEAPPMELPPVESPAFELTGLIPDSTTGKENIDIVDEVSNQSLTEGAVNEPADLIDGIELHQPHRILLHAKWPASQTTIGAARRQWLCDTDLADPYLTMNHADLKRNHLKMSDPLRTIFSNS